MARLWLLTPVQWVTSPCSVCVSALDAKHAEPPAPEGPDPGARRHQLPLDLDALATLAAWLVARWGSPPLRLKLPQLG